VTVHDIRTGIPFKPLHYAVALAKVKRILRRIAPDLLHTHFLTGYGYWGAFSGFHPFILTVWGDDVYVTPFETRLKGALARTVLRRADLITGDSRDILSHVVAMGADPAVCHVVQWGVDLEHFRPEAGKGVRRALGIPEEAPVVISIRSFTQAYYNIDVIVRSIPRVLAEEPETRFIIAGNEGDDSELRALARSLGLDDRVRFVGRIPHADLPGYLAISDVFLTVPSVDATPVSLLEAMACGAPVVVSDLESALEWVTAGENGLVVQPAEQGELEDAILTLIRDPDMRRRFAETGIERVVQGADHTRHMARMERLCEDLVARHGRVRR
jgi:glycosyltransferase involved in cell wall biosynthesis